MLTSLLLFVRGHELTNLYISAQIPYQTNKATLVQKIAELAEDKVSLFGADVVVWLVLT